MKLSEMSTKQLKRAMVDLTIPVSNIVKNPDVADVMANWETIGKKNAVIGIGEIMMKCAPSLLTKNDADVMQVASVLTGKSIEVLEEQNGRATIREIIECVDSELLGFFKSSSDSAAKK